MRMDDRTKSMITILLIVVGAGILLERSSLLSDLARGGRIKPLLQADSAIVLPTGATSIDVLSNDVGLEDGAANRLIIVQRPACGTAFIGDGEVQYIPAKHCTGSQTFRYGFFGGNPSETGLVRAMIRYDDVPQNDVSAQNEIAAARDQEIGHVLRLGSREGWRLEKQLGLPRTGRTERTGGTRGGLNGAKKPGPSLPTPRMSSG